MHVWQMPSRQPKGSSRPASSPATRIGLDPSDSACASLRAKTIVAALALLAAAQPELGLEALHVQAVAVGLALPVLGHGVEHLVGAREEGLALAPVRAEVVEVDRAHATVRAGDLQVQAVARLALAQPVQAVRRR